MGDFDGDGHLDFVVANDTSPHARYYINNGTSAPWSGVSGVDLGTGASGTSVAVADVDLDGDLDIVIGRNPGTTNLLYLNNGDVPWTGFAAGVAITADAHNTQSVALGDANGDGYPDLIAGNSSGSNRLYLNDKTGDPWDSVSGITVSTGSAGHLRILRGRGWRRRSRPHRGGSGRNQSPVLERWSGRPF